MGPFSFCLQSLVLAIHWETVKKYMLNVEQTNKKGMTWGVLIELTICADLKKKKKPARKFFETPLIKKQSISQPLHPRPSHCLPWCSGVYANVM